MKPKVIRPNSEEQSSTEPTPSTRQSSRPMAPVSSPPTPKKPLPAFMQPGTKPTASAAQTGADSGRRFSFRPKKSLIALIIFILLLGSAAAYFGYFLPNSPNRIWQKSLVNTGKGYDKLSDYMSQRKVAKGTTIKGSFRLTGAVAADGTIDGASDGENSQLKASLSAGGLSTNLDLRSIKSTSVTPDIYLKVDGIKGLGDILSGGDPQLPKLLDGINGQWYFIDHSFFDQYAGSTKSNTQFTNEDFSSILRAIGDANRQYVFTDNSSKMAFTIKQNVGKENQDGRKVYHYKAGINKPNLKAYASALCNNLKNSKLNKFWGGNANTAGEAFHCGDISKSVDSYDDNTSADVWVDLHTKLIHKIRFSNKQDANKYFDIGQDFQGGDEYPFLLGFSDKNGGTVTTGSLKLTLNTKTNGISISGNFKSSGTGQASDGTFDLAVTPSNNAVKVDKPSGAKSVIELLNDLGLGGLLGAAGSTDLNSLPR